MNKEMPLSLEWMPQSTYMHNSSDHLLPADQNQRNFVFIKQEAELIENTLNTQSIQYIVHLQEVSSKEQKQAQKQNDFSNGNGVSVVVSAQSLILSRSHNISPFQIFIWKERNSTRKAY